LAGQSWQMAVRLRPAPRSGLIVVGKRWPPTNSRVPPTFPCATGRSTYRAVTDWDSDKTQINFCIEQTGPTDHYFDHTATNNDNSIVAALRRGSSDSLNQTGQQVVRRNLNIQPTLTIRPGFPVRVIVNRDLVLAPYQI